MGVTLEPGYDFTARELVTSDKLRLWISGTKNTDTITGGDVGMVAYDMETTATWSSNVTEGYLCYNTSKGMIEVRGRDGWIPLFGTQNGMYTMRVPLESNRAQDRLYAFNRGYYGISLNRDPYRDDVPLPPSAYSAGIGFDNFGFPVSDADYHTYIPACITGADGGACETVNRLIRYPTHWDHNETGGWTAPSSVTTTSVVEKALVQFGGIAQIHMGAGYGGSNYTAFQADYWAPWARRRYQIGNSPQACRPLANFAAWENLYGMTSVMSYNCGHARIGRYDKCYF